MSNRASARVFYGLCFDHDSKEGAKFRGEGVVDEPTSRDTTPVALWIWGEPREGVQVVAFGHTDHLHYGLALKGTVQKGGDWCALALGPLVVTDDVSPLRDYCAKHGLEFSEAKVKWWAVPYYG